MFEIRHYETLQALHKGNSECSAIGHTRSLSNLLLLRIVINLRLHFNRLYRFVELKLVVYQ